MTFLSLTLTAADSAGNAVTPTRVPDSAIVIKGPDGKSVGKSSIKREAGDPDAVKQSITINLESEALASKPLTSGEYTIEVTSGGIKAEGAFTVVGPADMIDIMVGEADENGEFDVTITAKDAAGNPVADGTLVGVEAPDLRGDGDKVLYLSDSSASKTKAGEAKATLVEIGPGDAAIIVTVDGITKVRRYESTYGAEEPEAMPEEEASVACLSNLNGFATWACGVESSASEIFGLVSGRGATALHLWNGSAWVRYSVVDGTMVPGSSDFMVAENDILYISN